MSLTITTLVLLSALLHPIWNLLIKKDPDPNFALVWFTVAMMCCALLHALATGANLIPPKSVWPLLALSFGGQVLYGTCLTATLKRGDLSIYYPIIRASPIFIVAVGVLFLGRRYELLTFAGMLMTIFGGMLLLYRRDARLFRDPATLGLAVLAMCGTGIYSIADEQSMQVIPSSVQMLWIEGMLIPVFWLRYWLAQTPDAASSAAQSPEFHLPLWRRITWLFVPGIIAYTSYTFILIAYKMGGEVGAVTSVRQASIPLSVLLGGYFLRESSIVRRLIASVVLTIGIILVVLSA